MIVIDASVLVKYIAKEEGWDKAYEVLKEGVYTIELALKEAANALWKKHKLGEVDRQRALEIARRLPNVILLLPQRDLLPGALEIAMRHGITVYDALYIAAAKKHNATLVTADAEQAEIARREGVRTEVLG